MSDPLSEYEKSIREQSQSIPRRIEESMGMPFEEVQQFAHALFDGLPSDVIIKTVRAHLLSSGITMDQLNVSMDEMIKTARKYVTFVDPAEDGKRTLSEVQGSMRFLNYMYLGFLVTEYAEFLFAEEE